MRLRAATVLLAGTLACADKGTGSAQLDSSLPILAAKDTGSKDDCPPTGLWLQCTVLYRLDRSGFAIHADSMREVREPRLAISGKRLPIGRGELEIFLYADTVSRARDQSRLDTAAFIPPTRDPSILRQRTLIANQNLLVLMNVANETNRDRIANALMAGPPQPKRPTP